MNLSRTLHQKWRRIGRTLTAAAGTLALSSVAAADLNVAVSASPDPARPGELLDVEITVTNDGLATRTDVLVVLDYPAGLSGLSNNLFEGSCPSVACESGEQAQITIDSLPAGKGTTFRIPPRVSGSATDGTIIDFFVDVFDDGRLEAAASSSVVVDSTRTLELSMQEDRDPAAPGEPIRYTLTYGVLESGAGAPAATLSVPLPPEVTFVEASHGGSLVGSTIEWSLGNLNPGASGEREFVVEVNGGATVGSIIALEAFLDDASMDPVVYAAETRVQDSIPLELSIVATPDPVRPGETMRVELTVGNSGLADRSNVVLRVEYPDDLIGLSNSLIDGACPSVACESQERAVFNLGTLPAGKSRVFTLPIRVAGSTDDGIVIPLEADVSDASGDLRRTGTGVAVNGNRELELALVDNRDPAAPSGELIYTLTYGIIEDSAGSPAAMLRLPIPDGLSFISASDGGINNGGVVEWSLGNLNPGAVGERFVTFAVDSGVTIGSTLRAQADMTDAAGRALRAQTATRLGEEIPLELTVVATPDPVRPSETIALEVTVANTSFFDRAGVELRVEYPDDVSSLSNSLFDGACASVACEAQERAVFSIGTLPAGEGRTFTMPVRPGGATDGGTVIAFHAELTDNTGDQRESGTAVAVTASRLVELAMIEDRDPAPPGGELASTLTYGVLGTSPGSPGAMLRLPVPDGASFVSASDGGTLNGNVVEWSLGSLNPGASGERRVVFDVSGGATIGSIIVSEATLRDAASPNRIVRAQTATRVQEEPTLELSVIASPDPAAPGETLELEITVANTSLFDRSGVIMRLEIPDEMSGLSNSLFDGSCPSVACESLERAVFNLGTLPAGEGRTFTVPARIGGATLGGTVVAYRADLTDSTGDFREAGATLAVSTARGLDLALRESDESVEPGDTVTYILTYGTFENAGGAPNTTLRFVPPAGTTVLSASNDGALVDGAVTWPTGSLNPGAGGERTVTVEVNPRALPGSILHAAASFVDASSPARQVRFQESTRVEASTPLDVELTVSPRTAQPGATFNVELAITNRTGLDRSGVTLYLEIPDHLASLSNSAFDGSCPSVACEAQERATFNVGTLSAGQTISFPVTPQIAGATLRGTVINVDALAFDSTGFLSSDGDAVMVGSAFSPVNNGDFNDDSVVNVLDLLALLSNWGACEEPDGCYPDLNGDGVVNVLDLLTLLGEWG